MTRFSSVRGRLSLVALTIAVALLTLGITSSVSSAEERIPLTASHRGEFNVEPRLSGTIEAVQMVVDFPAGARVGRHTHGGPGYITMLQNDLTMWIGAEPMRTYTVGESFEEPFKLVAEGANLGAEPSSVLVTYLLPLGAPVTILEQAAGSAAPASAGAGQLPPGASPRFESRMRVDDASTVSSVSQALRRYAVGASSPSFMPGRATSLLTVVEGEVVVLSGTDERTYHVGESWIEMQGVATLSYNAGSTPAVAAISVLHRN